MEEKLRNLSKNIENNTGENAFKPEDRPPKDDDRDEIKITVSDSEEGYEEPKEREEEHEKADSEADYKEPDEGDNEDYHEDSEEGYDEPREREEEHEEPEEEHEEDHDESEEENHEDDDEEDHDEEAHDESEEQEDSEEEEHDSDDKPETHEAKATILSMNEDGEEDSDSHEKHRARKYSPEVESALDRLNSEETEVDLSEPLSTEPKEKHGGGKIIVAILLVLAIFAIILCVLVEQNLIDNPFSLFTKESETSKTETNPEKTEVSEEETELTDRATINSINRLFKQIHSDGNYYVYSRTTQTVDNIEYVYYYVAEPDDEYNSKLTNCAEAAESDVQSNCVDSQEIVNIKNYESFPHYRYIFQKMSTGSFEFYEKEKLNSSSDPIEEDLKDIENTDKE